MAGLGDYFRVSVGRRNREESSWRPSGTREASPRIELREVSTVRRGPHRVRAATWVLRRIRSRTHGVRPQLLRERVRQLGRGGDDAIACGDVERRVRLQPQVCHAARLADRVRRTPIPHLWAILLCKANVEGRRPARRHQREGEHRAADDPKRKRVRREQRAKAGRHPRHSVGAALVACAKRGGAHVSLIHCTPVGSGWEGRARDDTRATTHRKRISPQHTPRAHACECAETSTCMCWRVGRAHAHVRARTDVREHHGCLERLAAVGLQPAAVEVGALVGDADVN
eukprot:7391802-Prymnesium_polylepis.2